VPWGSSSSRACACENLFVINRETGPHGEIERFVFTGKGWGHGVGLCQVGAFGMAQAGARFDDILKHYYTGISLSLPGTGAGRTGAGS
jgi:stage II sporulation protein D